MTRKTPPVNVAASVRARLLQVAKYRREDFTLTLMNYAAERFLYRLSQSSHRQEGFQRCGDGGPARGIRRGTAGRGDSSHVSATRYSAAGGRDGGIKRRRRRTAAVLAKAIRRRPFRRSVLFTLEPKWPMVLIQAPP